MSRVRRICWISLVATLALPSAGLAQTVWTGPFVSFSKLGSDDPTLPQNQDPIVPGVVALTRGPSQGVYNAATETGFTGGVSPADTEWAFPNNNPTETVEASNYAALQFDVWATAHGGNPGSTVGQPAVVHIISQDIYLDFSFTNFTGMGTADVAWDRATPTTVPGPSAGWVALALLASGSVVLAGGRKARVSPGR